MVTSPPPSNEEKRWEDIMVASFEKSADELDGEEMQ